ncbi:hypothetical protein TNCV_2952581 [Trichonephila clavipes]|nr:hypothetical protein TNCV_2952581 [Trichonephila clavipes]
MTISKIWNRWVHDGNTGRRAGSQRPPIASSGENRHVTLMVTQLIMKPRHEPRVKNWGHLQDNNCLLEQFDDVCRSMDSQPGDHGFGCI